MITKFLNNQLSRQFSSTAFEVRPWVSNYIPLFDEDVISNPCPTPTADLANVC